MKWSSKLNLDCTYFSALTHIDWHSSKVMFVNTSASKGPPNRLFSSLMKTANPSHLRSAEIDIILVRYKLTVTVIDQIPSLLFQELYLTI